MSEQPRSAVDAPSDRLDASPILVWNGLVTRMRRVGAGRRATEPEPHGAANRSPEHGLDDPRKLRLRGVLLTGASRRGVGTVTEPHCRSGPANVLAALDTQVLEGEGRPTLRAA